MTNRPDDVRLLRDLARSFVVARVRDPQEHIRIAAYTALADMGASDTLPILEDGRWIHQPWYVPAPVRQLGGAAWQHSPRP